MSLYSKPVRSLMKDMANDLVKAPGGVFSKQAASNWFSQHYPKIKAGTISAHLIRLSTNAPSRTHHSVKPGEDDVLYQIDGSHFRRYVHGEDPAPIYPGHQANALATLPEGEDETDVMTIGQVPGDGQFAYEADLRNYLAKNLGAIEPGLRLYEDEGVTGLEFPVGGRFIDILAVDSQSNLVVIELKVSRGYDRVVGQLMRYVAWIKKNLADNNKPVRGIILAREISEDLILACSLVPRFELFEYELSVALKRVSITDNPQ